MTRNRSSFLFVLLVTAFWALPSSAQEQLSGEASFTEGVAPNQYGPFVESTMNSVARTPKRFGLVSSSSSSCSSSRTFSESTNSVAVKPSIQETPGQVQPVQHQTHTLSILWESVQVKTPAPDSPWTDVK